MKILHRLTRLSDPAGWCGQVILFGTNHDGSESLDSQMINRLKHQASYGAFQVCQSCLYLNGDTVPRGGSPPMLVHKLVLEDGNPAVCGQSADGGQFHWLVRAEVTDQPTIDRVRATMHPRGAVPCPRCRVSASMRSVAESTPVQVDDGFNGNCLRCGKRTYMGATPAAFEHQGGPCPHNR